MLDKLTIYLIFHFVVGFLSWGWYWYSFTEFAKRSGQTNIKGAWLILVMLVGIFATILGPVMFVAALIIPRLFIGSNVPRKGWRFV